MIENNFNIYKAAIYEVLGANDDRLRVRILPYMTDIDDDELPNLPCYPPFFKGQVITGISEIDFGKESCDCVWVVATSDFQTGFILGKANAFGANTIQKYPYSYNYAEVKQYLSNRHALPDNFDYDHIIIRLKTGSEDYMKEDGSNQIQDEVAAGGMIELYNYLTGDYVLLNTSGTVLCVMQHQIYARVGTPSTENGEGSTFSALTIKADTINLKSQRIFLDGKAVMLGAHNLYVVGMPTRTPTHAEGVPLIPMESITG
jgi:hypothetical protein